MDKSAFLHRVEKEKRFAVMYKTGDNIISSLGFTTEENFSNVQSGISGVKSYKIGDFDLPEAFMASLINKEKLNDEFVKISSKNNFSNLEKAAILSVFTANNEAQIDLSNEKTLFILSTTKGNVDLLDHSNQERIFLWHTAELVSTFFKNKNTPVVVSNACISGASAQIVAMRELQSERYDHAVVTGVDFLSKFIISGFQSFKALSPELCRPFDKKRCGLNLGEAASTIIFSKNKKSKIQLLNGVIRNDANHISAPSRTGEGCYRALKTILQDVETEKISFINAHGTSTPYNDASEANALVRAGLQTIPVNSLKAYFGHTLGAAGILESVISMKALEKNMVLKTLNFEEQDFENKINVAQENLFTYKSYFVKLLSGFGGCNAALVFAKNVTK